MKNFLLALVVFCVTEAGAVIIKGDADNTNAPAGGNGWDTQGYFYPTLNNGITSTIPVLGTVIGKRHFVTVLHVQGRAGDAFVLGGVTYLTASSNDHSSVDLRVWRISGQFPANIVATTYSKTNEMGKEFYVFGCGPKKRDVVTTLVDTGIRPSIANFSRTATTVAFDVFGHSNTLFQIQSSTNLTTWATLQETHMIPDTGGEAVILTNSGGRSWFRAKVQTVITNGWMVSGVYSNGNVFSAEGTGIIRWGVNNVEDMYSYYSPNDHLVSMFDASGTENESALYSYDSGGGLFINDGGTWKLAGITTGGTIGPYADQQGDRFWGAMMDFRGLTALDGNLNPVYYYPMVNFPLQAVAIYVRISSVAGWLQSYTN